MTKNTLKLALIKKANLSLKDSMRNCNICPRKCGVDRAAGRKGYCRAPANPVVYSFSPHHGEEPPISGKRGSGTIFFSYCNMKCAYCQNYRFSQLGEGQEISAEKLSKIMLNLQKAGCHNINFVSPTHFMPQILMALEIALQSGLKIPLVYNTGGYDLPSTIRLLDGIIDIYLPDMRYADNAMAKRYSDAVDYIRYNRECIEEMYRQTGNLVIDDFGVARKGLIIRLLVLPNRTSGTKHTLKFLKEKLGTNIYLSIMSQYYPTFKAYSYKEISAHTDAKEYKNVVDAAHLLGLNNGWIQDWPSDITDAKFLGTNIKPKTEL